MGAIRQIHPTLVPMPARQVPGLPMARYRCSVTVNSTNTRRSSYC
jgi:hypothetical protein